MANVEVVRKPSPITMVKLTDNFGTNLITAYNDQSATPKAVTISKFGGGTFRASDVREFAQGLIDMIDQDS